MPAFPSFPPGNLPDDVELVGPVPEVAPSGRRPGGARRKARRRAVDVLFEAEARAVDPMAVLEARVSAALDPSHAPLNPYVVVAVTGVAEQLERIDEVIASHLNRWRLDRLPAVDRAILRLAVWELLHSDEVPPAVAVDEAVELAQELSNEESPSYVNGILGQVALVAPQVRAAAVAVSATPDEATPSSPVD